MGLADDLQANPYRGSAVDCVLDDLDGEDRDALLEALRDPSMPVTRISQALKLNGYATDPKTIARWRRINGVG